MNNRIKKELKKAKPYGTKNEIDTNIVEDYDNIFQ